MTVEEKALIWARRQKGNVLNNKNVDCFIAGYNTATGCYGQCIPYNDDTKHLVGTNEEAPEYYRHWED